MESWQQRIQERKQEIEKWEKDLANGTIDIITFAAKGKLRDE
jgi:hypothetical protein